MDPKKLLEILDKKIEDLRLASRKQPSIELFLILVLKIITKSSDDFNAMLQDILNNLIRKVYENSSYQHNKHKKIASLSQVDQNTCFEGLASIVEGRVGRYSDRVGKNCRLKDRLVSGCCNCKLCCLVI